ncbi:MAG: flagellar export chaperone FliS [Clostridiales bacterium]|jgi:flagellar protein FliS|nr:flagellar export chaperone FliS [Clostridiales bacterium]
MAMQTMHSKLQENAVYTMPPEALTLMLYDGALKFCNQSIKYVDEKNFSQANETIQRAQDIIREFQLTLNRSYPISKYLDSIYDYIYRRLVEANLRKDTAILNEVRELLRELRDTWKEAMALARQNLAQN